MTYRQATALIFAAVICVTCVSGLAFTSPPEADAPWTAEVILYGTDLQGALGCTYMAQRPIIIEAHNSLGLYPELQRWVVAHELFHALGWMGHPFSDPMGPRPPGVGPDGRVILMDTHPAFEDPDSIPAMPVFSELERCFLRQCAGTLYVIVDADDITLVDALVLACDAINAVAGRPIIQIRAGPVTLR